MDMQRYFMVAVALAVSLYSSSATSKEFPYKVVDERSYDMHGDDLLEVEIPKGEIEIALSEDNRAYVTAKMFAEKKVDLDLFSKQVGDKVDNEKTLGWYRVYTPTKAKGAWIMGLDLRVPIGTKISAKTGDGEIKILQGIKPISLVSKGKSVEIENGIILPTR